jgi:apolipoprotein N-acyltransferase
VAGFAAGGLFALAAPPTNLYPALWLGLAALAHLVGPSYGASASSKGRLRLWFSGAAPGLAFGTGANVVALRFVPDTIARFTPLPWAAGLVALLLLSVAQGLRWATATVVLFQLGRRGVPRWVAFGAGVYASTFVPAVFPWNPAGGMTPVPQMVQLAELVGERGVTLLMALSAGLMTASLTAPARRLRLAGAALGVPLLMYAQGCAAIACVEQRRATAPTVTVGLVQPATGPLERWDADRADGILLRLTNLTRTVEKQGAELTVWPEAAYPFQVAHASRYCPTGARAILPMGVRGPVLTGVVMSGANGDLYNSATLCRPNGTMSVPYDKLRLLMFGETVPVLDRVPWIRRTFSRGAGLVAGEANVVQSWDPIRASVLDCFEDTLPDAGRDAMADRPNLLINLTNDAWFAGSAESELHLRLAVLRAIESRRDLVRAVNLGPTTWVDAAGVVRGRYDSPLAGALVAKPSLLEWAPTLFDRFGDLPTALLLGLSLVVTKSKGRRENAAP